LYTDALSILELLGPMLLVIGAVYLLGPLLPLKQAWARRLIFVAVWLVVARYLDWRFFETVQPARGAWYEIGWIWLCFAVELLAVADQLLLYITFLRPTDRRDEADAHEARLRALPPAELPSVDVFIPTYNETIEVLEKTIIGALCLDYPNVSVWVLDDGRRPWLKNFCEAKGAGYLTRPDNSHAKAGNINHALVHTSGQFVAIFDADFVPQRNFLMRTIGFFTDPSIGIVQCPHAFYNHDPMQANLAMRKAIPDEQRFFFDAIMPSRDGWDAAFCCGSNSLTRRAALDAIGGSLPTNSITEDMLLTLTLLREGYVTRYLCERLAFGLAPENVDAFFVQRQRWARGAIQILYLRNGPFGRKLALMQRLLFLPTHWLSVGLQSLVAALVPIVFLWTGTSPVANVTAGQIVYYLIPAILAVMGGIGVYAPGHLFPLAAQVLGLLQSFKILPSVLLTLIKPRGHAFKVTPKGTAARQSTYARGIFWSVAAMMLLTISGLVLNALPEWRIANAAVLPIVAFWAANNVVVLFLTCMMTLQAPTQRDQERFEFDEPISIFSGAGALSTGRVRDMSLSGLAIMVDQERALMVQAGEPLRLFISEVGFVSGRVVRRRGRFLAVKFELIESVEHDLLIRKLFTSGLDTTSVSVSTWSATIAMLRSIWSMRAELPAEVLAEAADGTAAVVEAVTLSEKLPPESLIVSPRPLAHTISAIVQNRRAIAA
jgi:cellulose synthase (UDP-forming)